MRGSRILSNLSLASDALKSLDWTAYDQPGRSGVLIHPLYDTADTGPGGPAAAIVRYLPGARVLRHRHPGYELIYVLEGELINDSGRHGPGTLEVCAPDSAHALRSDTGCVFLVVWEQPVEPDREARERLHLELLTDHGS